MHKADQPNAFVDFLDAQGLPGKGCVAIPTCRVTARARSKGEFVMFSAACDLSELKERHSPIRQGHAFDLGEELAARVKGQDVPGFAGNTGHQAGLPGGAKAEQHQHLVGACHLC